MAKQIKHFLVDITTKYDGMEWGQRWVTNATSEAEARAKAEKEDFTHDDGIEKQEIGRIQKISEEDFNLLVNKEYIYEF